MTATTAKTITRATITTKKFIFVKFWCLDRTLKDNHVRGFWKTRTGTCKDKTDYFGKWCIFQTSTILSNQRDLESNFSFQNIHQSFLGKDCKLTHNETYQTLYIIQCTRSTQMYKCTKAVQEGIHSKSEQQTKIQMKFWGKVLSLSPQYSINTQYFLIISIIVFKEGKCWWRVPWVSLLWCRAHIHFWRNLRKLSELLVIFAMGGKEVGKQFWNFPSCYSITTKWVTESTKWVTESISAEPNSTQDHQRYITVT